MPLSLIHISANLRVLYLDENAVPLLSERRSEVLLETDLPLAGQARVQDAVSYTHLGELQVPQDRRE